MSNRRALLARVSAAIIALLWTVLPSTTAAAVSPSPTPHTAGCAGVWVVIDATALPDGELNTYCATDHSSGLAALSSILPVTSKSTGFVTQIDGIPADGRIAVDHYWSYWHATPNASGVLSDWVYSEQGASDAVPSAGSVEGWKFVVTQTAIPPTIAPEGVVASTTTAPSVSPSATATTTPPDTADPTDIPWAMIVTVVIVVGGAAGLVIYRSRTGRRQP